MTQARWTWFPPGNARRMPRPAAHVTGCHSSLWAAASRYDYRFKYYSVSESVVIEQHDRTPRGAPLQVFAKVVNQTGLVYGEPSRCTGAIRTKRASTTFHLFLYPDPNTTA